MHLIFCIRRAPLYIFVCRKYHDILHEVMLLSRLRHPNIVQYFGHFFHGHQRHLFIILEFARFGAFPFSSHWCICISRISCHSCCGDYRSRFAFGSPHCFRSMYLHPLCDTCVRALQATCIRCSPRLPPALSTTTTTTMLATAAHRPRARLATALTTHLCPLPLPLPRHRLRLRSSIGNRRPPRHRGGTGTGTCPRRSCGTFTRRSPPGCRTCTRCTLRIGAP